VLFTLIIIYLPSTAKIIDFSMYLLYVVFKKITGMITSDYLKNGETESIEFL